MTSKSKPDDRIARDQLAIDKALEIFHFSRPLFFYGRTVLGPDSTLRLRGILLANSVLTEAQADAILARAEELIADYRASLPVVADLSARRARWQRLERAAGLMRRAVSDIHLAGDINSASMLGPAFRSDVLALRSLASAAGGELSGARNIAHAMQSRLSGHSKHSKVADRWLVVQLIENWRETVGALPPDTRRTAAGKGGLFQRFVCALLDEAREADGRKIVRTELVSMIPRALAVLRAPT